LCWVVNERAKVNIIVLLKFGAIISHVLPDGTGQLIAFVLDGK